MNYNWGCAYASRFVVLAEDLNVLRLKQLILVEGSSNQATCPF